MNCGICNKSLQVITNTHLKTHNISIAKYTKIFPNTKVGFLIQVKSLPKTDPRYLKWLLSLKGKKPWNKGKTKLTNISVEKISNTFKKKRLDNFHKWREQAKIKGLIPRSYSPLRKNTDLAFLIGMILGDGNLSKTKRAEYLGITLGTDKPRLYQYVAKVMNKVFSKEPIIRRRQL